MTSATVKEQAQSPQVLRMHRNRAIDSRIRGYLAMSAFLDKDEVTWKERKKILVHILVWKMEHGKEDITEKALMDELSAIYGPDHLGELLADMNGKLISYGQKADMPLQITELGKAILLGTVRDIIAGKTE